MEAEHVGDGLVEMALLPREQILSRRCLEPLGQLYDGAFRHESDRNCLGIRDTRDRATVPEDILVTDLLAAPVGGWNSKFR